MARQKVALEKFVGHGKGETRSGGIGLHPLLFAGRIWSCTKSDFWFAAWITFFCFVWWTGLNNNSWFRGLNCGRISCTECVFQEWLQWIENSKSSSIPQTHKTLYVCPEKSHNPLEIILSYASNCHIKPIQATDYSNLWCLIWWQIWAMIYPVRG